MASTTEGNLLTARHRTRQARLSWESAQLVAAAWPLLSLDAIDESWARLEPTLMAVTIRNRSVSASMSARYYDEFRGVEGARGRFVADPTSGSVIDRDRLRTSLRVTGPFTVKRLVADGVDPSRAGDVAQVRAVGAVQRHVLDGGRGVMAGAIRQDRYVERFARVTGGNPCYFCAMLASRGAVYKSLLSADFKVHDHCACSVEPVYDVRRYEVPARSRDFEKLWSESTEGLSGNDAVNAFRRSYERGT
jgi:hypothetical protein